MKKYKKRLPQEKTQIVTTIRILPKSEQHRTDYTYLKRIK